MRYKVAHAVVAGAVLAVFLMAVASGSAATRRPLALSEAAKRTADQPSLAFDLTAHVETLGAMPYDLHAHGALGPTASHVTLKVADVQTAAGQVLTGPSAVELTDGAFLYLRSTVTTPLVGGLWVRERLSSLHKGSPELRLLRDISPRALLQVVTRAQHVTSTDSGRVYHGTLPYADALVARTLRGLEAGTQYRHLRLTAWVSRQGRVLMLVLRGRTADRSSTLLLALTLEGFGKPVSVRAPGPGSFVDFDLSKLSA
jgi:hypothetical protein